MAKHFKTQPDLKPESVSEKTGVWLWDAMAAVFGGRASKYLLALCYALGLALAFIDFKLFVLAFVVPHLFLGVTGLVLRYVLRDLYLHKKKQEEMWADGSDENFNGSRKNPDGSEENLSRPNFRGSRP